MPYQKTQWINNNEPSINAQNLNKIEQGIYDNSIAVGTQAGLLDGHTVRADVPSNAVFTDTIYDDTALTARVQTSETNIETLENTTVKWSEQNVLGAKNLLPYPYTDSNKVLNGVTFTDNGNGTVTVNTANGPATGDTRYYLYGSSGSQLKENLFKGMRATMKYSTGVYDPNCFIYCQPFTSDLSEYDTITDDDGSGFMVNNKDLIRFMIFVKSGSTISNLTVYPMLRLASIQDDTWVPYAMSNRKLTTDKVSWKSNGLLGAKNKIPYPHQETTKIVNGLTFTDNGDGTITVNGTQTTGNVQYYLCTRSNASNRIPLKAGTYRLTGCPEGGSRDTFSIYLNGYNAGTTTAILGMRDTGEGIIMSYSNDIVVGIYLDIRYDAENPLTFDNVVFRPMLTIGEDTDDTYAEYTMTNRELTVKKANTSMLGTDESGNSTASQAYAQGDYFVKDNQFCKAITSIASGATFTLNTNYAQYTLADILKAIENL